MFCLLAAAEIGTVTHEFVHYPRIQLRRGNLKQPHTVGNGAILPYTEPLAVSKVYSRALLCI